MARMARIERCGFVIGLVLSTVYALYVPSTAHAQNGNTVAPARPGSDSQAAPAASGAAPASAASSSKARGKSSMIEHRLKSTAS